MKTRRYILKSAAGVGAIGTALPNAWIKPVVEAVVLPAHAQTSDCRGQIWDFKLRFTEISCTVTGICGGDDPDPNRIEAFAKPNADQRFCLSDDEIASERFHRDIDLDGMGMAADYLIVEYTIETKAESEMSGVVVSTSVDTFLAISGKWAAQKV